MYDLNRPFEIDENLLSIFESVPNGIMLIDSNGKIFYCNSETDKMFGYGKNELFQTPIEYLIPMRYREHHVDNRNAFIKQPSKRQMGAGRDLSGLRKDGKEIPVEIGLNPLQINNTKFTLALIIDITERKTIEDKLQKAYEQVRIKNEEMEQFVYTVSHDLKAPLVTSTSFIGFLREDIQNKNYCEIFDSLDRLEKSQKKMQELINDLLELSRAGQMNLKIESVDMNTLLLETVDHHFAILKEKKVSINILNQLPTVFADKKRLGQVLDNLINNSIKYASEVEKPSLHVFSDSTALESLVCIKDNRPGIDPQYHKKIFELFQRLETNKEGTGVGLTIVSRIMQLHRGRVWVNSQLGQGAEFWLSFPKSTQIEHPIS